MATVTNLIRLPDGSVPSYATVAIELVAAVTESPVSAGWVTATHATIMAVAAPLVVAGAWTAELIPNADIDPAGTVYRVIERVSGAAGAQRYEHYISVGAGGGTVHDLLTDAPGALAPSALAAHLADTSGVHGISDTSMLLAHSTAVSVGARNIVAGSTANTLGSGSPDASMVIGGGSTNDPNRILGPDASLCTIVGGYDNDIAGVLANSILSGMHSQVQAGATHGCVVGGSTLIIGADTDYGIAAGGLLNTVSGDYSGAFAGATNTVSGRYSTALGGSANTASGLRSTALGGTGNTAGGDYSICAGINSDAAGASAVVLGLNGLAYGGGAAIIGGDGNTVGTPAVGSQGDYSAVVGGLSNDIGNSASARFAAIIAGRDVSVNGEYAGAVAGQNNAVGGNHASAVGGINNSASAARSVVVGGTGNAASGASSIVLAGASNTASGAQSLAAGSSCVAGAAGAVAIGNGNGAYGLSAAAVGGAGVTVGNASIASRGDYAGAVGGLSVTIGNADTARFSGAVGGRSNVIEAEYCATVGGQELTLNTRPYQSAVGYRAISSLYGAHSHASGYFAAAGDAQHTRVVARATTADAVPTALFLDGAVFRLLIPDNRTWAVKALIAARRTDGTEHAGYEAACVAVKGAAGSMILKSQSLTVIHEDVAAWTFSFAADTVNGGLTLLATGEIAKTIRWVATLDITQVG